MLLVAICVQDELSVEKLEKPEATNSGHHTVQE